MIRNFTLPSNGLRAILLNRPGASDVAVVVALQGGSRDDPASGTRPYRIIKGEHHCAEHYLRRASSISSWSQVTKYFDNFSTEYNGSTDKSSSIFWMKTDRRHATKAIRFLASVVSNRSVDRATLEVEQERTLQEIWTYQDEPDDRLENDFDRVLWARTGLDHPVLGTEVSVRSITPSQLRHFIQRAYVGQRLVVAMAGGFDPALAESTIRHAFGRLPRGTPATIHEQDYRTRRRGLHLRYDATLQLHTMIGWPTPGLNDPQRLAVGIIRNALTDRDSSRLQLKLDGNGLGYSLEDFFWCYRDVGEYHLYLALSPDHLHDALRIVTAEVRDLQQSLMSRDEFQLAKRNLAIKARTKVSDAYATATFAATQTINAGRYKPLRTYLKELRAVTRHQIRQAARDVLTWQRMMVVIRGPVRGLRRRELSSILRY